MSFCKYICRIFIYAIVLYRNRTYMDAIVYFMHLLCQRFDMLCVLGGSFLAQIQKGMISAFLRRMYKYHLVSECFDINSIVDDMDRKFLKVLFSPVHCLHSLLPPVKSNPYGLRSRDHNFQLPVCNNFSRKSFIIRSLFRFKYA